jgi:hypothetical protein
MWWPEGSFIPAFYISDEKLVRKLVFVAVIKYKKILRRSNQGAADL